MDANSNSFIRVRLLFDYPPPAVVHCRMCWLLVDLKACRVVADLESVIRDKFELSSRSILSLFVDDCYLPHTEHIFVVRDNDSVRVKVDSLPQVNGHSSSPDTSSKKCKKRQRPKEDDGPGGTVVSVDLKEKKRKKRREESVEEEANQASCEKRSKKSQEKHAEKKKTKKKSKEKSPAATPQPAPSTKPSSAGVEQPVKRTKKPPEVQGKIQSKKPKVSSSDSSSSSSEENEAPKRPPAPKPAPKTPSSTSASSKAPPVIKPIPKKSQRASSSSSEMDSSSDDGPSVKKVPAKNKPQTSSSPKSRINDTSKSRPASSPLQSTNWAQTQAERTALPPAGKVAEPRSSDGEEEIELVIRKPMLPPGFGVGGLRSPWRGSTHGRSGRGDHGDRGRGRGRGQAGSFEFSSNGSREPSYQTDSLSNKSVVIQNGVESGPKQDYSTLPLLAAPPQVGQKIAFKLLELGENYAPEISEYKEGKIVSFDLTTKQIELQLLHASQAPVGPGKFDLVYQNADGSESVEYAVSRGAWVTERWDSLLEPRLII